ncbi:hypothetical protein ACEOV3_004487 [Salmonella enterica subsp. enterica serovar Newport]|nr:hypothetical protein [Salmonella enterica]EJD4244857.1 hypothetical protein [Salmonella enterica]ELP9006463.1 hypothetical protein [Salmonella enterica]
MNRTKLVLVIHAWFYIALVFAGCGALVWTTFNPEYLDTGVVFAAGTIIVWYKAFKVVKQLRQIRKGNVKPLVL